MLFFGLCLSRSCSCSYKYHLLFVGIMVKRGVFLFCLCSIEKKFKVGFFFKTVSVATPKQQVLHPHVNAYNI